MKRKTKRIWTPEQRQAAAERMRVNQALRRAEKNSVAEPTGTDLPMQVSGFVRTVAPEVQAVLDTMTPERKAKLAMIQARTMTMGAGRADGIATQEAIARHEAEKSVAVAGRTRVTEYLVRLNGRGEMVSQLGPCWCGVGKREWHSVH